VGEVDLSPFENDVLDCLLDDAESTSLVIEMLADDDVKANVTTVKETLRSLQRRGLVTSRTEMHHADPGATDTWWALTDAGFASQGYKMTQRYRERNT
jgi:DNA-binding PadR family transcriptional regulator